MLRYSTYKSIYEPSVKPSFSIKSSFHRNFSGSKKLLITITVVMLLVVTSTGMISAFASSGHANHNNLNEVLVVSPGESLWSIAVNHKPESMDTRKYVSLLREVNQLNNSDIRAGDVLELPSL